MTKQIWRLSVRSTSSSLDTLSGALYLAGYEGIEIVESPKGKGGEEGQITVRAYAVARDGIEELARVVTQIPDCDLGEIEEIPAEDWAENWKKYFKPIKVGGGFVVLPPWASAKRFPGRIPIVIDPGHAFGTGTHASTRLVLAGLEGIDSRIPSQGVVADLGTGSGILAVAAVKLGLAPVTAIDIDPEAVQEAKQNARANNAHLFVRFVEGDQHDVPDGVRLLTANLSAPVHRAIAPLLAERLVPGGRALLAGLLADEFDGVVKAWPDGWEARRADLEEWALVEVARPAS
jgi:ribosomal protein L11 methyltransferase